MANIILRMVGILCLGGAAIAASSWWKTQQIMNPVSQEIILSTGKPTSLSFRANQEVSERRYDVRLYFENTQKSLISCDNISSLGIQWYISTSDTVKSWNNLSTTDYTCKSRDDLNRIIVSFLSPSFQPGKNYYFHLSTANKRQNSAEVKVHAAIQHEFGIGTHYLFMDLAGAELLGGGLFVVGLSCFLIDCFCSFFQSRTRM